MNGREEKMKAPFCHKKLRVDAAIEDPYYLEIELRQGTGPDQDENIAKLINDKSPHLLDTLPLASFKDAEAFFMALQSSQQVIDDGAFALQTLKVDKHDLDAKVDANNPFTALILDDFEIPFDYQNVTKPLFESIFNDPDNLNVKFKEKIDLVRGISDSYLASTGLSRDNLARVPKEDEVKDELHPERPDVTLDVPAQQVTVSEPERLDKPKTAEPTDYSGQTDQTKLPSKPVYVPGSGTVLDQKEINALKQPTNSDSHVAAKPSAAPVISSTAHSVSTTVGNTDQPRRVQHDQVKARAATEDTVNDLIARATAEPGLFEVKAVAAVGPEDEHYVDYALQNKRRDYNEQLLSGAKKITARNGELLLAEQSQQVKDIEQQLSQFRTASDHTQDIHHEVGTKYADQHDLAEKAGKDKLKAKFDKDTADAKARYEAQIASLTKQYADDQRQLTQNLNVQFEKAAVAEEKQRLSQQTQEIETGVEDLRKKLLRAAQINLNGYVQKLRGTASDVLLKMFQDYQADLDADEARFTTEHLNAMTKRAAVQQAENESRRVSAPYDSVHQLTQQLSDMTTRATQAESQTETLKSQHTQDRAEVDRLTSTVDTLKDRNEQLAAQREAANRGASRTEGLTIEQALALGAHLAGKDAPEPKPTAPQHEDQLDQKEDQKTVQILGLKRLLKMALVLIAVLVAGVIGGGFWMHSQTTNRADNQAIWQSSMSASLSRQVVQHSSGSNSQVRHTKKVTKNSSSTESSSVTVDSDNERETRAFDNLDLAGVQALPQAKYAALDTALLNNNCNDVRVALSKLKNYQLNSKKRTKMTLNILRNNYYYDLSNQVENVNV